MKSSSCIISDTLATFIQASEELYLDSYIIEECTSAIVNLRHIASMLDDDETWVSDEDWDLLQESLEHLNSKMAEMTDD